jgi:lipopolysaccharide export system permease protein
VRFLPFFLLLAVGLILGFLLAPFEEAAVRNHLLGFPNADPSLHRLRPLAIFGLCLVPSLGALWYGFASILDRYLFRRALGAFFLVTVAFLLLFILLDLQDSLSELTAGVKKFDDPLKFLGTYYVVQLSQIIVLLLPFTILLGLLYSLGQLSASREIIAFTQSGRGIVKLLTPLLVLGGLLSLVSFFLNFHLAPWAEGYRDALLDSAERDSNGASQASNVIHRNADDRRVWFIEHFPYDLAGTEPLRDVRITTRNEDGSLRDILSVPEANWQRESGVWEFSRPMRLLAQTEPTPEYEKDLPAVLTVSGWPETPSQLIQEGLDARYLGIPSLIDWLNHNTNNKPKAAAAFETRLQYRWAQPVLCLVAVLLAAPLGISFSRRSRGGAVALAIMLSALMLFSAEVFLSFGDSGRIPAHFAAWATNGIFALLGLILIQRRLTGRPIFQTFRKCFGN